MKFTKGDKRTNLEKEIDNALSSLKGLDPSSEEYTFAVQNIETLYKAKSYEANRFISRDTLCIVGGNLLGILIILGYEKADIITSKALGFVIRGRV